MTGAATISAARAFAAAASARQKPVPAYRLALLGDPVLRQVCRAVQAEDLDFVQGALIPALRSACTRYNGLGISAPQLGIALRVSLVRLNGGEVVLINPRIVERSPETVTDVEGCLSIPGFYTSVARHALVTLEDYSVGLTLRTATVVGRDARIVQHVLDILDGKLILDGCPRQQRRQAERLVAKARERGV